MLKFESAYDGPYVVKVKMSKINFILQIDEQGTDRAVHHNKLKLYMGECPQMGDISLKAP